MFLVTQTPQRRLARTFLAVLDKDNEQMAAADHGECTQKTSIQRAAMHC